MTAPELVLASTSPYRRQLLQRLGVPFAAVAPSCDEEALKDRSLAPQALAEMLAKAKAESVAEQHAEAIIIGSDQVAECGGMILDKPGTVARATEQLAQLSGRSHQLVTAVCVWYRGQTHAFCDVTTLSMRELDAAAIARYVAADRPLDCAGAYKLEAGGIALFEGIDARDHSAITGLPLIALTTVLTDLGLQIP